MTTTNRPILISAFLLMLASAFVDNLRGSLIPLLHQDLQLGFAVVGGMLLTVAGLAGAVFNSRLLVVENKFGIPGLVFYGVGLLMLAAIFSFSVTGALTLAVMSIPLGGAITSMGTSANLMLVMSKGDKIKHRPEEGFEQQTATRARMMAGLHMMYGVGSLAAPATASLFVSHDISWSWLFLIPMTLILFPIGAVVRERKFKASLGHGKRSDGQSHEEFDSRLEEKSPKKFQEWFVVAIFLAYVAGEVLTSMWMPSFLIHHMQLDYKYANKMAAGFFIVFSLARLGVFLGVRDRFPRWLAYGPLIAAGLLMIYANIMASPGPGNTDSRTSWLLLAFPAAGMIGPFFPMMLAHVSTVFHERWQQLTVIILTSMQIALAVSHVTVGALFDKLGPRLAYFVPPTLLIIAGFGTFLFMHGQEKSRRLRANP